MATMRSKSGAAYRLLVQDASFCALGEGYVMKRHAMHTHAKRTSTWSATAKMPRCRKLEQTIDVDVCVVGGGIAGLTTAYLLAKAGKEVALLEDGTLASGMTSVTSAHLSNEIDDGF